MSIRSEIDDTQMDVHPGATALEAGRLLGDTQR